MSESMSTRIALFPLMSGLFPESVLHLNIFEVRYLHLMKECHKSQTPFGVVRLNEGSEVRVAGQAEAFYPWGTLATIQTLDQVQPSLFQVKAIGGQRFYIEASELGPLGVWYAQVRFIEHDPACDIPKEQAPLVDRLGQLIATAQQQGLANRLPFDAPYRLDDAGWVANRWAELLPLHPDVKVDLLKELDPIIRLQKVMDQTDL